MSNTKTEVVTDDDVADAERAADEAAALVDELEARAISGDDSITADDIANSEKLSRFARIRAKATAAKAAKTKEAQAEAAGVALRAEILSTRRTTGKELAEALQRVAVAAADFYELAQEHDGRLSGWKKRALALGISNQVQKHGIYAGDFTPIRIDGEQIDNIDAGRKLSMLFHGDLAPFGRIFPAADDVQQRAFDALAKLGTGE